MHREVPLTIAPDLPATVRDGLGYRDARDALVDARGRVVREVPYRRTFAMAVGDVVLYRKHRDRRPRAVEYEWGMLGRLAAAGVPVPRPAFVAASGGRGVLGVLAAPGVSLFELFAADDARDADVGAFVVRQVAPLVARFHRAGFVHRDLYWHHLFAPSLALATPVVMIDVERVFRPWWRRRRWIVKDLAALVASWPRERASPRLGVRFLRAYTGGELPPRWKTLARAVLAKAARIRGHVPRHDPPPGVRRGE